jgi:hypothetical protein
VVQEEPPYNEKYELRFVIMILVTFIYIHFVIICDVLLWRTYETHPALFLKSGYDNITGPARRRGEGTTGDGGEDDSGARGPLGRPAEDSGDVPVHVEPWYRTWFCSTTCVVPSS